MGLVFVGWIGRGFFSFVWLGVFDLGVSVRDVVRTLIFVLG